MNYNRQQDLVHQDKIAQSSVTIIGCGAIGSAVAMTLAKMGVCKFSLYDEDGVDSVNLPNQMYRVQDLNKFKVEALAEIIKEYNSNATITAINKMYIAQPLEPIVIVATDSMYSRAAIWQQYCAQKQAKSYIEARMGAEEGQVYTLAKDFDPALWDTDGVEEWSLSQDDIDFYNQRLYTDSEAKEAPCTAKAIIYNVFMIAALMCRAYKAIIHEEKFPREVVFGMAQIHRYSFQVRE